MRLNDGILRFPPPWSIEDIGGLPSGVLAIAD
jgi:hypothetical protein